MKMTSSLLAAALMLALPMGGALACTVGNWNGANTATNADTGGPDSDIARYSGECALTTGTNTYVIDNSPGAEDTYRVRFYVLPRATSGSVTVFKATTADDSASGSGILEVSYNNSTLTFTENGNTPNSVSGVDPGKWYSVELFYKAGERFDGWVWGKAADAAVGSFSKTASVGSGVIGSAVMGVVSGTVNANAKFNFDAFESTRSADDRIYRLCRGDANRDNKINALDAAAIIDEYLNGTLASGQPDANEDGTINALDAGTAIAVYLDGEYDECQNARL